MTTLAIGSSITLSVGDGGSVNVSTSGGLASVTVTPTVGAVSVVNLGPLAERRTLGPFTEGATAVVSNASCGALDYDYYAAGGGLTQTQAVALQALVSPAANLGRLPSVPSTAVGSISDAYKGGATPWTMLYGPNELRQAPWGGSNELTAPTAAAKYVTAASGTNGPCMFRVNGASQ